MGDNVSLIRMDVITYNNRQQANISTCYVVARAYSLEQQNAGRAHAGLSHTSRLSSSLC